MIVSCGIRGVGRQKRKKERKKYARIDSRCIRGAKRSRLDGGSLSDPTSDRCIYPAIAVWKVTPEGGVCFAVALLCDRIIIIFRSRLVLLWIDSRLIACQHQLAIEAANGGVKQSPIDGPPRESMAGVPPSLCVVHSLEALSEGAAIFSVKSWRYLLRKRLLLVVPVHCRPRHGRSF